MDKFARQSANGPTFAGLILGDGFISMIPYSNHKKN